MVLNPKQQSVRNALLSKETKEYPVSQWYVGALYALDNPHNPDRISQAAQSLREFVEKLPRVVHGSDVQGSNTDFAGMRRSINDRILKDKKRYPDGWKDKVIDSRLDKTLRKVENYFERNRLPTRQEQMQQAVSTIDPMVNQLDRAIQDTKQTQLLNLWKILEGFAHHKSNADIEGFNKCLEELENIVLDLLAPETAQNQQEIQAILSRSDRSDSDVERMFSLIERRGANSAFFFKQISENADTTWLSFLEKKGYFTHPPSVRILDDGGIVYPFWWPIRYLMKISDQMPDEVIEIVSQLPKTDNPRVYDGLLEIALQLRGQRSARLKPKMLEYIRMEHQSLTHKFADLLIHWTKENQTLAALELSKVLVAFSPDPQSEEKRKLRKEDPMSWNTSLRPSPRINPWDYTKILSKGVCVLAESKPYKVAHLLIDAIVNMIRLKTHQDEFDKQIDFSDIWCPRFHDPDSDLEGPEETLIHTLSFACKKVYENSPVEIENLDEEMRKQKFNIFKRLRQYLYAQYPNDTTKPWIYELIISHKDYNRLRLQHEFQQMIRSACEHFRENLLTKEERIRIFDSVRSGPPKRDFQDIMGEEFTKERFEQWRHNFHRIQFSPFQTVLFGEYKTYFQELDNKSKKPISEDDYPPFGVKIGSASNRSPRSSKELADLTDENLLNFINDWEKEDEFYERDPFVRVNIETLANAFQTVFKETIIPDTNKLKFWMENREKIERPIYVRMIIYAIQSHVKEKNFDRLDEWFTFCEWVLSHPDQPHKQDYKQDDESRESPSWSNSRRAVGDFIGVCLEKDVDVPIDTRGRLAKLLEMLCTQFDWHLDECQPKNPERHDPIAEGINNTRSRALENLIEFGYWLRKHEPACEVSEVMTILEKRLSQEAKYPLTLPEYAILGKNYKWLFNLNATWATEHKSNFFPQNKQTKWLTTFRSFILCNDSNEFLFNILKEEFKFALQNLTYFSQHDPDGHEPIVVLGQRLLTFYLLGMYPLKGEESLLERFYEQTDNDREHWGNLFKCIGHRLWNTSKNLDQDMKNRILDFFEWRFKQKEPKELRYFAVWLQAECLDVEWRLNSYSNVLDICEVEDWGLHFKTLYEMLPHYTAKVLECFVKITDGIGDSGMYIYTEEAIPIINTGLKSDDESIRKNAKRSLDNLLRSGKIDLSDLNDNNT